MATPYWTQRGDGTHEHSTAVTPRSKQRGRGTMVAFRNRRGQGIHESGNYFVVRV